MLKKFLIVIMSFLVLLSVVGCGGDNLTGLWMTKGQSGFKNREVIDILHIDKADDGKSYLISMEYQSYQPVDPKGWYIRNETAMHTEEHDEVINNKEAFTWKKRPLHWGYEAQWTGVPLKIAKIYERKDKKFKEVLQCRKEELPLKDGKLLFNNASYVKTDKAGLDKVMADWKERLKKQVGEETVATVDYKNKNLKTIIARVTIREDGKEEVFE